MLAPSDGREKVTDKDGGASRDRTDDLIVANDALSQLSYSPACRLDVGSVILSAIESRHKTRVPRPEPRVPRPEIPTQKPPRYP
jgi:hypothetical protein